MSSLQDVLATVHIFASATQSKAVGYYVDYSPGADTNAGTTAASAWQLCPCDPNATSNAVATPLNSGDTVCFKCGVSYLVTAPNALAYLGDSPVPGVALTWSGAACNPIVFDGDSAGTKLDGPNLLGLNVDADGNLRLTSGP